MTVNNHLTCLCNGAGEACTQNQGIEAGLEQLDHVLTGLALGTLCLEVCAAHLCLADVVLSAQTLLFLQLGSVVGVSLLAGTAVLAGAVRTTLEVLFCLRGQCNAQGTGLTHGTAGAVVLSHNLPFYVRLLHPHGWGLGLFEYWPPRLTPPESVRDQLGRCCTAVGRRARGRVPRSYITDTRTGA